MTVLYHYTCRCGRRAIGKQGLVLTPRVHTPQAAAQFPDRYRWLTGLSWFTAAEVPDAVALGLTAATIRCDRTEFRYRVTDVSDLRRWLDVCHEYPADVVAELNGRDHRPEWWWVADTAIPVRLD